MLNEIKLIGRLGKDVSVREMQGGDKVATFSLATSERWTKNGEKQERTFWHNVVIFNQHLVKIADQYLRKGSLVYVCGAMQYRQYEKDGHKVNVAECVLQKFNGELTMLESKSESSGGGQSGGYDQSPISEKPASDDFLDENIPF